MDYKNYIEINSNVRFGKPCIIGTRITVYDVLGYLASGMSKKEIIKDYPSLSEKEILACLAYSADRDRKVKVAV